jgi:hypothetical protein
MSGIGIFGAFCRCLEGGCERKAKRQILKNKKPLPFGDFPEKGLP